MHSQESRYGFRIGLNYSDIDFDESSFGIRGGNDDGQRYGFTAGFFATYFLSEKISIQPELQYVALGETSEVILDNRPIREGQEVPTDELTINTLQLPILFNYHFGDDKFTISAGPQIGVRIWEWERETDYETLQFSAIAGIGYHINDNVGVNLRASYGLTDVIDTSKKSTFSAKGVNHYVQFTVFYRL